MVELLGVHGADEANVIGDGANVGQQIGKLHAAFAVTLPRPGRRPAEERSLRLQEGKANSFVEGFGQMFAIPLNQLRLGVKQIELAGSPRHENENARLCLRSEMRSAWCERIDVGGGNLTGQNAILREHRT